MHFSLCFWAKKHPGEAVPTKAVTADDMAAADPLLGVDDGAGTSSDTTSRTEVPA
jgi:hypothetical protein